MFPGHGSAWVRTASSPPASSANSPISADASALSTLSSNSSASLVAPRPGSRGEAGPPEDSVPGSAFLMSCRKVATSAPRIVAPSPRPHARAASTAASGSDPDSTSAKVVISPRSAMTMTPRSRSAANNRGAPGIVANPAHSRTIPKPPELWAMALDRKHLAMTVWAPSLATVEPSTQHRATLVRTPSRRTSSRDNSVPRTNAASSSQPSPISTSWLPRRPIQSLATSTVGEYTFASYRREP